MAQKTGLEIHLLDMGVKKFGDCLVVRSPSISILIDGGHPGDQQRADPAYPSIPEQLTDLYGHGAPFVFDLLVVTHCHVDHIGCLPALVKAGTIAAKWALVADERLGWGKTGPGTDPMADAPEVVRLAVAALREDGLIHGTDDEISAFLSDSASLESTYGAMLAALAGQGTQVVRYGKDDPKKLVMAFADLGFEILGPSKTQLLACARALQTATRSTADRLIEASQRGDLASGNGAVALYRFAQGAADSLADAGRMGAALNCQSLVLTVSTDSQRALLTGDLQFARPGVPGIEGEVAKLRKKVAARAPYQFAKIAHHGSANAFDKEFLSETGSPLFAISGGIRDRDHPAPETLQTLGEAEPKVKWARTDRNGRIDVRLGDASPYVRVSRSRPNDATPKSAADEPDDPRQPYHQQSTGRATPTVFSPGRSAQQIVAASATEESDMVEVVARFPRRPTRVVLTIEVDPLDWPSPSFSPREVPERPRSPELPLPRVAAGRAIARSLLFVTEEKALARNIGLSEAGAALDALRGLGAENLVQIEPGMPAVKAAAGVAKRITKGIRGVVLVGGYDVVPPLRMDVLSAEHRKLLKSEAEWDGWIVWSDEPYADTDNDAQAELPVSRIPDARDAKFLFGALAAGEPRASRRFAGLRSRERPFAEAIWAALSAPRETLLTSGPQLARDLASSHLSADALYFMLHGDKDDARSFWGEDAGGQFPEAVRVSNVSDCRGAVVFGGCCWGALLARPTAWLWREGEAFEQRGPGESMALALLGGGANAFVGPTGVHYSPDIAPYGFFGGPLHSAFWRYVQAGKGAAEALFLAKNEYFDAIPHEARGKRLGPDGAAIEKKIAAEFTCLGLGW